MIQAWQKCPICNGIGYDPMSGVGLKCTVCKGYKIISALTGRPPLSDSEKEAINKGKLISSFKEK